MSLRTRSEIQRPKTTKKMKFSTFKPTFPLIENETQEDASFSTHSLSTLIEELKKGNYASKSKLNSIIFFRSPEKQILLTAFREGAKLKSFQSNDSMTFQIMEGKIMFHTPKESFSIEKGQLMKLRENISYSITAHEDSLLLLTILTGKKNNNPANSSSFQDQNYGKQYEFN